MNGDMKEDLKTEKMRHDNMQCLLTNQHNDLLVNLVIEKFMSVELKDGKLVINNIIKLPVEDIMEIKVYDKEAERQ